MDTHADVDLALKAILDKISAQLIEGGRVEVRGFGNFALNYRPLRTGRNPKTGAKVEVPPSISHTSSWNYVNRWITMRNTLFIGLLIALLVGCETPGKLTGSSGQKVIYTNKIPIPE